MLDRKKVLRFIESNFPSYKELTVIRETEDTTVVELDYGTRDIMRVIIGQSEEGVNIYKLLQTDFI